jgi:hypothetical protein
MTMQRSGVELGQYRDVINPGINTIADGNVNEAILARNRDGGFRANLRKRMQARTAPAPHNDSEDIIHVWHVNSLMQVLSVGRNAVIGENKKQDIAYIHNNKKARPVIPATGHAFHG